MIQPRTMWGLIRYFLYLGSLGFGGPVALIGYIQRDLVEQRGWFTKVVIPYPWFDKWSANSQVRAFVKGVTAAAAGAIAGACFVLGKRAIFDGPTAALAVAALVLPWRFKVPEPILIVGAGLIGFAIFWLRGAA